MTPGEIIYIDIIGTGNVATHLFRAFKRVGNNVDVSLVNPHTFEGKRFKTDFTIIAVKDDAITEVANRLTDYDCGIIAHTSGSTSLQVFESQINHFGVFYPLQTFSKDVKLDYSEIPFFIEASDKPSELALLKLASLISDKTMLADSDQRRALHVAAVFACNFTNHLIGLSNEILGAYSLPLESLKPLITETVRKAFFSLNPYMCQTGPAVRGDETTMNAHLKLLDIFPEMKDVYNILSNSIKHKHVSN